MEAFRTHGCRNRVRTDGIRSATISFIKITRSREVRVMKMKQWKRAGIWTCIILTVMTAPGAAVTAQARKAVRSNI